MIDATVKSETKFFVNITKSRNKICLRVHYNLVNSFFHTNDVKTNHFKAKKSGTKLYPLCLRNISKDVTDDNMKKTWLNGKVYDLMASYDTIHIKEIENIH